VFVDDSSFEVNLIRERLPEITVIQVPERLFIYPKLLRQNIGLFYNLSFVIEDRKKTEMYKQQVKREAVKKEFTDIEDYIASLGLKMTIYKDKVSIVPRMSQLSLKTNQFNLTTKRYSEEDIKKYIKNDNYIVFAFSVSDKFGDSGITGLCIIYIDTKKHTAYIDTFLMSCRIIGRNIEYAFIDYIISRVKERNINHVEAQYIKTQKNEQVKDFFLKCSFSLSAERKSVKYYSLDISKYGSKQKKYIEIDEKR